MKKAPRLSTAICCLLCAVLIGGCSPAPDDLLAESRAGKVTLADLDAFILSLPPQSRRVPGGKEASRWIEQQLRHLGLKQILAARMANQETAAREAAIQAEFAYVTALSTALARDISESVALEQSAIDARIDALSALARTDPLVDFQHIYLAAPAGGSAEVQTAAAALARQAAAGENFAALARAHSQSANAATGGLVQHARLTDLDTPFQNALDGLEEGDISPVIQTRSGYHILRLIRVLEPDPAPREHLANTARQQLIAEATNAAIDELLAAVEPADAATATIGEWRVDAQTMELLLGPDAGPEQRSRLRGTYHLAAAARARGLDAPDIIDAMKARQAAAALEAEWQRLRAVADGAISDDVLRPYFEAQPSLFATEATFDLDLAFVPQGKDAYATQLRVTQDVQRLRNGDLSFEAYARQHSTGPNATDGGRLGSIAGDDLNALGAAIWHAAVALDEGAISDPIYVTDRVLSAGPDLLRGGFAIIRLNARTSAQTPAFEDAREAVRKAYADAHRGRLDEAIADQLFEDFDFRILRIPAPEELRS